MLQLADLGSVPAAFIFPSAFIAPFEGGPANKLRGLLRHPAPPAGSRAPAGRAGGGWGAVVEGIASSGGRGWVTIVPSGM